MLHSKEAKHLFIVEVTNGGEQLQALVEVLVEGFF